MSRFKPSLNYYNTGIENAAKQAPSFFPDQLAIERDAFRLSYENRHRPDYVTTVKLLPAWQHMRNIIKAVYPDNKNGYVWNPWSDIRFKALCNGPDFITLMGCGSSGKSTDAGLFLYQFLRCYPYSTTVNLYSTTKGALKNKVWKDIVKFHKIDPGPFKVSRAETKIVLATAEDGSKADDTINGIFAQAILRDSGETAVAELSGMHNAHNFTMVDEMQGTPQVIFDSLANQMTSGETVRFIGCGNPISREDMLCKYGIPWDGWASVDEHTGKWVSRVGKREKGLCVHFHGLKSPAITEFNGAKKYGFLTRQSHVDAIADRYGTDSWNYYSQVIGFPTAGAMNDVFLDQVTVDKHGMRERAMFMEGYTTVCGFDAAFSVGNDRAMLCFARCGWGTNGKYRIDFMGEEGEYEIPIKVSETESVTDVLEREIIAKCTQMGVKPEHFAMDTTGQETLADLLTRSWGKGIMRVAFNQKASRTQVSRKNDNKGFQEFVNRVAEIWTNFAMYARAGQICGMSSGAIREVTSRKKLVHAASHKTTAEKKIDMKSRIGFSPDNADAKMLALLIVKDVLGVLPFDERVYDPMSRRVQDDLMDAAQAGGDRYSANDQIRDFDHAY